MIQVITDAYIREIQLRVKDRSTQQFVEDVLEGVRSHSEHGHREFRKSTYLYESAQVAEAVKVLVEAGYSVEWQPDAVVITW